MMGSGFSTSAPERSFLPLDEWTQGSQKNFKRSEWVSGNFSGVPGDIRGVQGISGFVRGDQEVSGALQYVSRAHQGVSGSFHETPQGFKEVLGTFQGVPGRHRSASGI